MQITILEKAKKARVGLSLAATFSLILSLFSSVAYAENLVARMSGHWSPKHQSAIHSQIFADEVTKRSNGRTESKNKNELKKQNIREYKKCKLL